MLNYRNILRIASEPHKSMRTMDLELHSSHHPIRKILDTASKAGINCPISKSIANKIFMDLLFPEEYRQTVLYAPPDYPYIHAELTRTLLRIRLLDASVSPPQV